MRAPGKGRRAMRKEIYQVTGDRLKPAQSVADKGFVADQRLTAESAVPPQSLSWSPDGGRVLSATPNAKPDLPGTLPSRREPKERSSPQASGDVRHPDREGACDPQKPTPSAASETFLTEEELAARWNLSAKTLRNSRVAGRLLGFVKIGRSVRYRLPEVIAYEARNSVRSTSGDGK